ncbi:CDP-alcohol phosphatidyltransferase family protein [bacterium]|nr:CDP-alcohol phosphatidyltransferase family protein [bacterium]
MFNTAVILIKDEKIALQKVAGVSVVKRAVLSSQRSGISNFFILTTSEKILKEIQKEKKFSESKIEFLSQGSLSKNHLKDSHFLFFEANFIFHQSLLNLSNFDLNQKLVSFYKTNENTGLNVISTQSFVPFFKSDFETSINEFLTKTAPFKIETSSVWAKISDKKSVENAKDLLFTTVTKKTSGFISKNINAKFSIPVSKVLAEFRISPNAVTCVTLTIGLLSSYLLSQANLGYFYVLLGGILWQLAAIVDRCDGELARVKMSDSKFGGWFDTVTDNIAYVFFFFGVTTGMYNLHPENIEYLYFGGITVLVMLFGFISMYTYVIRIGSASLQTYNAQLAEDDNKSFASSFLKKTKFMSKRDFFSLTFFVFCLFNHFELVYWSLIIGGNIIGFVILFSQRKMMNRLKTA